MGFQNDDGLQLSSKHVATWQFLVGPKPFAPYAIHIVLKRDINGGMLHCIAA
jgi:hypothetical protein